MKKFFKLFITLLMFFTITACTNINNNSNNSNSTTSSSSSESIESSNSSSSSSSSNSSSSNSSSSSSSEEILDYAEYTFENETYRIYEDGRYTRKYEVAIYIHVYHKLPSNYYTKRESKPKRTVENKVAIGGDRFGNKEGHLPHNRTYTEVDIVEIYQYNSYNLSNKRGVNRIVYSNQFEIYFTSNHYKSFDRIYFN